MLRRRENKQERNEEIQKKSKREKVDQLPNYWKRGEKKDFKCETPG